MFHDPLLNRLAGYGSPQAEGPAWTDHPSFSGVRLCRLVSGCDSGGRFTTLLVSLAPRSRLLPHRHENEVEQHLVLKGEGHLDLDGQRHSYQPGCLLVIPEGAEHSVAAGESGMVILATFSPALP